LEWACEARGGKAEGGVKNRGGTGVKGTFPDQEGVNSLFQHSFLKWILIGARVWDYKIYFQGEGGKSIKGVRNSTKKCCGGSTIKNVNAYKKQWGLGKLA